METQVQTIASLRELLSQRFPSADRPARRALSTGIAGLDERTGGLPRRALTELVCAAPSCGGQLFFGQLLDAVRAHEGRVALIDGADEFDPGSWQPEALEHLVWVRCSGCRAGVLHPPIAGRGWCKTPALQSDSTGAAVAVADLFARDANLELVALDLRRAPRAELRRIPSTAWYRLQRAVEQTDLVLLVLTPHALVPSAQLRLVLDRSHKLSELQPVRADLCSNLSPTISRHRLAAQTA